MRSKKGMGLVGLLIASIIILSVLFLFQNNWIQKAVSIRSQAKIFIELNDQTSKMVSLLRTRTGDLGYLDSIIYELETLKTDGTANEIKAMSDEMDTAIFLYENTGKVKEKFGKRVYGNPVFTEIPLPGGRTAKISFLSDYEMPEEEKERRRVN